MIGRVYPQGNPHPLLYAYWKRHPEGGVMHDKISSRPVLQFVSIQRRDTSEWALPGGKIIFLIIKSRQQVHV